MASNYESTGNRNSLLASCKSSKVSTYLHQLVHRVNIWQEELHNELHAKGHVTFGPCLAGQCVIDMPPFAAAPSEAM